MRETAVRIGMVKPDLVCYHKHMEFFSSVCKDSESKKNCGAALYFMD